MDEKNYFRWSVPINLNRLFCVTRDRDNLSAVIPPFESTHDIQHSHGRASSPTTVTLTTTASHGARAQSPLTAGNTSNHCNSEGGAANKSRHGSPTSSRSVSFMCDEVEERSGSGRTDGQTWWGECKRGMRNVGKNKLQPLSNGL